jgi:hypothetical protein
VIIRRVDDLPDVLDDATRVGPYSTARPGMLLRVVPGVGRFLARDGETIEYCVDTHADPAALEALLEGGVFGALLHQRGDLPLHATTLISQDRTRVVALAGHSGAGKSTTAYELIRRGWMMVSDDLTRVTIEDGVPVAWPGRSRLRLLTDACDNFDIDIAALATAPNWPGKYVIDVERWPDPVALNAFVSLQRFDAPFQIEALRGAAAARVLAEQTYRVHYVAALGKTRRHLELIAAVASRAKVLQTSGRAAVAEVANAIVASAT